MGAIAFLSHNLMVGCVFGSYGLLMPAVEKTMGLTRDIASLGIPMVMVAIALSSSVIGAMVEKVSLRLLMITGAVMMSAGYAILSLGPSVPVFLGVYALLIGPAMSLNSSMVPTVLVTRWYQASRGRALGIIHMPLLSAAAPPVLALMMTRYGLSATYLLLAATGVLILLSALFVIDRPPGAAGSTPGKPTTTDTGMTSAELFRSGRFWALSIAFAAIATGASVRSAHIVPLAMGWGIDATRAAVLISVSSIGGMLGSPVWGWVAERLGGARVLAILCIIGALGWVALLLKPPFLLLALLSAAMGFASGAVVPVVGLALSQVFGQPSFGRAFGLANLVSLPYTVVGVPAAAVVFVQTGSYTGAMIGLAVFGLLGLFCALKLSGAPRLRAA